jgi:hypothetical protein
VRSGSSARLRPSQAARPLLVGAAHRKPRRPRVRRAPRWRDLVQPCRIEGRHGGRAAALQRRPPSWFHRLMLARLRGLRTRSGCTGRCAIPVGYAARAGAKVDHEPRGQPDLPARADQSEEAPNEPQPDCRPVRHRPRLPTSKQRHSLYVRTIFREIDENSTDPGIRTDCAKFCASQQALGNRLPVNQRNTAWAARNGGRLWQLRSSSSIGLTPVG